MRTIDLATLEDVIETWMETVRDEYDCWWPTDDSTLMAAAAAAVFNGMVASSQRAKEEAPDA